LTGTITVTIALTGASTGSGTMSLTGGGEANLALTGNINTDYYYLGDDYFSGSLTWTKPDTTIEMLFSGSYTLGDGGSQATWSLSSYILDDLLNPYSETTWPVITVSSTVY
jgi:hypothetical protein